MKKLKFLMILSAVLLAACRKDPQAGIKSHERAIESVTLGGGLAQVGPAVVDRVNSKVTVRVLLQQGTVFTNVIPTIIPSYKSTITPASKTPVNFAANNNQATYAVTSETGETRKWTVILQPFTEGLLGTFKIQGFTVYGGTGPQYGGGGVFDLSQKGTWPANGPAAEYDNMLTFNFTDVTPDGNTEGTMTNDAGPDGLYANYIFTGNNTTADVNYNYRVLPKGNGRWIHNYSNNTVTLTFDDGTVKTCAYDGPGTVNLGNGLSKTIQNNAFTFKLTGADDYNDIYSDFDKVVKRPYTLWVDVVHQ